MKIKYTIILLFFIVSISEAQLIFRPSFSKFYKEKTTEEKFDNTTFSKTIKYNKIVSSKANYWLPFLNNNDFEGINPETFFHKNIENGSNNFNISLSPQKSFGVSTELLVDYFGNWRVALNGALSISDSASNNKIDVEKFFNSGGLLSVRADYIILFYANEDTTCHIVASLAPKFGFDSPKISAKIKNPRMYSDIGFDFQLGLRSKKNLLVPLFGIRLGAMYMDNRINEEFAPTSKNAFVYLKPSISIKVDNLYLNFMFNVITNEIKINKTADLLTVGINYAL